MIAFDAFHLPGVRGDAIQHSNQLDKGDITIRWPVLSPEQLAAVCTELRAQRARYLARVPVSEIVAGIDAAAQRMQAEIDTHTQLIAHVTGYSRPVVQETLTHMFADWRAPAMGELLRSELGDARVLDHPVPDPYIEGKQVAAYGFPLTFHIFSGNVPGVAVTSLVRALLVKSAALGKTASGEPVLPVLFARALHEVAPDLAACLAISYWPGGTEPLDAAAIKAADAVVIYGGAEAVRSVSTQIGDGKRLVVHGPRVSFGLVGPLAQTESAAAQVAQAVAAYDQQGCVSPHVIYVVGSAEAARAFAGLVAEKLELLDKQSPRGRVSAGDAVAIRNARTNAEFGAAGATELFGIEPAGYSVIFETDPGFRISCLNRVLYVKPLARAHDIAAVLPEAGLLQSAGLAGFEDAEKAELIRLLGLAGVSRVTSYDQLPWPPMHWRHDGNGPLNELLRWQDVEA